MKILVFSQYYEPEPFLIHDKMKELILLGHQVTVITGLPNYPSGIVEKGYKEGVEVKDGVKIVRLGIRPRKKGSINLFLNYLSYVFNSNSFVNKMDDEYDVVYVYQLSPVSIGIPAIKYKKKFNKKVILYCLDLWPESLISGGIKKKSIIYSIFKFISRRIYMQMDSIHISSRGFGDYFRNTLNISKEFIYNPQYAADSSFKDGKKEVLNRNKINITFTGNIGELQSLETAIQAMLMVDSNDTILNIVGDGSKLSELKEMVKELGLSDRVIFHGRQPQELMSSYMDSSDALLITLTKDEVISYTLPAKIQSYLKSGKFIIGSVDGEAANIINDSKAGIVSPAENSERLAENINIFIKNLEMLKKEGENGPKYYNDNFGKEKFINTLENEFKKFL